MADQTLAETSTLSRHGAHQVNRGRALLRKIPKAWEASCCWICYWFGGPRRGVAGLVDFVLKNHFFSAMQVPSELAALGEILAEQRPERALEIGTAHGGTLLLLTRLASPRATIVSVDLPGGRFGGGYGPRRRWFYQRFARSGQQLHLLQGDSHSPEMLDRTGTVFKGLSLDYLFIDGDHTYEGVRQDFELYSPLVRKGGVIAFHDIAEHPPAVGCEVARFWGEVKTRYRHSEFIEDTNQGWAGIGVLYVD
jgi:predicted O-methyltransferase YrrM